MDIDMECDTIFEDERQATVQNIVHEMVEKVSKETDEEKKRKATELHNHIITNRSAHVNPGADVIACWSKGMPMIPVSCEMINTASINDDFVTIAEYQFKKVQLVAKIVAIVSDYGRNDDIVRCYRVTDSSGHIINVDDFSDHRQKLYHRVQCGDVVQIFGTISTDGIRRAVLAFKILKPPTGKISNISAVHQLEIRTTVLYYEKKIAMAIRDGSINNNVFNGTIMDTRRPSKIKK